MSTRMHGPLSMRFARTLSLLVAGGALVLGACSSGPPPTHPAAAAAPPRLDAALAHRPALVSLWATWCEACSREFGDLNRLDARAKARGAVVLGVAVGEADGDVDAFAAQHGLRYALVADPDYAIADALGERRVPATLVVDRDGRIVFRGGALNEAALAAFERVSGGGATGTARR